MEAFKYLFFLLFIFSDSALANFPVPRSTIAHTTRIDGIDYRLPTHVKPVHYEITIMPDLENFTFDGLVKIEVEVQEETNNITLHVNELEVTYLVLVTTSNQDLEPSSLTNDTEKHFLIVNFEEKLAIGTYYINAIYNGLVNDGTTGFYRASYVDEEGNTR